MQSAYITTYGDIENIRIGAQQKPVPKAGEVLVEMKAAAVNPIDWKMAKGDLKALWKPPFPLILGSEGAGVVAALGAGVRSAKIGDEVFFRCEGIATGTFAQYVAVPAHVLAPKPANMSFESAAGLPLVGLTAVQALVEKGGMGPGAKVLVHAGAGGVGTFAIQYAKAMGAYVATTASPKRAALLKALGADEIIDYHTERIEDRLGDYDIVLDTLGPAVRAASYKVLKKGGILVSIQGIPAPEIVAKMTANPVIRLVARLNHWQNRRKAARAGVRFEHHWLVSDGAQLGAIAALVEAGKIRAVIDSSFPLDQVAQAFARSQTGRAQGKITITIN